MITLNDILHTVKSFSSPHPLRDWVTLLTISIATLLVLFVVALYYFLGINTGSIIGTPDGNNTPTPRVSRTELEGVVELFNARRVNYEENAISIPAISDPSL